MRPLVKIALSYSVAGTCWGIVATWIGWSLFFGLAIPALLGLFLLPESYHAPKNGGLKKAFSMGFISGIVVWSASCLTMFFRDQGPDFVSLQMVLRSFSPGFFGGSADLIVVCVPLLFALPFAFASSTGLAFAAARGRH